MKIKSPRTSSLILLLLGSLLIWLGYHIMKTERWADKYLFFIGLLAAFLGVAIICYLFMWAKE